MAVLRSVRIRNFKSILDQTLDLGRLNLLIGINGAGKSNFLEAMGMFSLAVEGRIDSAGMAARGMRLSTPSVFKSSFRNRKRAANFHLEATFDTVRYSVDLGTTPDQPEAAAWGFHAESLIRGPEYHQSDSIAGQSNRGASIAGVPPSNMGRFKRNQGIIPFARALGAVPEDVDAVLEALQQFAIYAPSTPILRGVAGDPSQKSPLGLYGGGLATALDSLVSRQEPLQLVKDFFSLLKWFHSLGIRPPDPELQSSHVHTGNRVVFFQDRFMRRDFSQLYAYDVSEGALYVLFVLLLLLLADTPPILALDNVDSALNPGLARNLIIWMSETLERNLTRQVFLTTHHPTALDGLDLFNPDHRLFVVSRNQKSGATEFKRIQPPEGMTREGWGEQYGEMRLSEIWLTGALGGMTPPLGF